MVLAHGIACLELLKAMELTVDNAILCDTKGVIFTGRDEGMVNGNQPMLSKQTHGHSLSHARRRYFYRAFGKRRTDG